MGGLTDLEAQVTLVNIRGVDQTVKSEKRREILGRGQVYKIYDWRQGGASWKSGELTRERDTLKQGHAEELQLFTQVEVLVSNIFVILEFG